MTLLAVVVFHWTMFDYLISLNNFETKIFLVFDNCSDNNHYLANLWLLYKVKLNFFKNRKNNHNEDYILFDIEDF